MTLEKAILDLESIPPWPNENDDPHYLAAIQLGIEAMKAWKERRDNYPMLNTYLLPGETKD